MLHTLKDTNLKFGIVACLNAFGLHVEEGEKIKQAKSYNREYRLANFDVMVQEVYDYYKTLEIPQFELDRIVKFFPSGSEECYQSMVKEWDGEDDRFDIGSLDGIEELHNMVEFNGAMLAEDGVDISALLKCPKLKKVDLKSTELTEDGKKVVSQLREEGVEVTV